MTLSEMKSEMTEKLLSYLPWYYERSRVMRSILKTHGDEVDLLQEALSELRQEYFVNFATWSLELWEYEFGLSPLPKEADEDEGAWLDRRRQRILTRLSPLLVNNGLLKKIALSLKKIELESLEDFANAMVIIKIIKPVGIPAGKEELEKILREMIPAHLGIQYEYNYLTWDELNALDLTWDGLEKEKFDWNKFEVMR